jgi:hypothetical protein
MSRHRHRHNNGQNGQRTFDLTSAAPPAPPQNNSNNVYIIVKYFDPQIDYCFQDRVEMNTYSFQQCGITKEHWTKKEDACALLKRLQEYNPSCSYGVALVPYHR